MRPAQPLLWLLLAWTVLAVVPVGWSQTLPAWLLLGALLALTALVDARAAPPQVDAARRCAPVLPVGVWATVTLTLYNRGRRDRSIAVFDHYPQPAAIDLQPRQVLLAAGGRAELRYRLRPLARGANRFGRVQTLLPSPLGLWQHSVMIGEPQPVRIFPDFAAIAQYALPARDRQTGALGIHLRRRRGEGQDFFQLREYRDGDSQRQIDWKATARHRKLISKEYQDERDQQVVFLLDCGRRLRTQDGELSHFDHVLNALILLSHIALRQGDAVGVQCFGGVRRRIEARKGATALTTIINALYDLQPTLHSADYRQAGVELMSRQRKRALIVVLSNLRDEDDDGLLPMLALLRRRHLVLIANLRETALDQPFAIDADIHSAADARLYAATCDYLAERERIQERLRRHADLIDAVPARLPIELVNQYLAIKRSGRL